MKMQLAVAIAVLFFALSAVAGETTPVEPPAEVRFEISALLIPEMLARHNPDIACFISWGVKEGENGREQVDPPAEFLKLFAQAKFPVQPVSACEIRDGGVREKTSGRLGTIYSVRFGAKLSETEYLVSANSYTGSRAAASTEYKVTKIDGVWQAQRTGRGWVS